MLPELLSRESLPAVAAIDGNKWAGVPQVVLEGASTVKHYAAVPASAVEFAVD